MPTTRQSVLGAEDAVRLPGNRVRDARPNLLIAAGTTVRLRRPVAPDPLNCPFAVTSRYGARHCRQRLFQVARLRARALVL
ncbi:hypothetical protein [Saxibacter everestensis]|uniref:hypothetical protein n=1 Tax=Saxibacter everestensis TaxID=2909229 RepID=UPI0032E3616C